MEFFLDLCCGASSPLSHAVAGSAISCVRDDILGEEPLDLSQDAVYDRLLRLAFSGCIKFAHASPPCRDYSRLKLRPGGPPAIRSPDPLQGLPGNTEAQQERVRTSQQLLYRCTCILRAVFAAGGHVSLEQPTNAMSWLEPFVQSFLSEIQSLVVIPACSVGQDISKSWLFATSFAASRNLQPSANRATITCKWQVHWMSRATSCRNVRLNTHVCLQRNLANKYAHFSGATFCRQLGTRPQSHLRSPLLYMLLLAVFCASAHPAQTKVSATICCSGRRWHLLAS